MSLCTDVYISVFRYGRGYVIGEYMSVRKQGHLADIFVSIIDVCLNV